MSVLFESPANQAVFDGALKKLNESITGIDSYIDGYRQKQIKIRGASGEILPNGHPQIPSVEAVFPYVPYWNEHEQCWQLRYHCANNVIITAAAINRFKFTSLPAVLSDIQQFRTTKKTADDRRELLKTLDKRHEVRCKVPFKQSARLSNAAVDADRVEQDIAEFKLGVPVDDPDGPWRQGFSRRIILRPAGNVSPWDQEEISILLHIVGQIELKFKMTLPRAGDGAPWIGTVDTMPEGWGWCMWFRLCAERLQRMKLECNKYWSTEDTETTLFLEIVYQYCSDEKQYEDFLGLPLTVYLRHPCNLSVGHRRHKQAMRTGWRSNPTSLDDRDEARNNILIETWTSNVYKFEYDEEYYPELHEMADQIEISSDHFNQQALEVRFIAKDDALQFAQASHHNAGEYRLEDDEVEELSHGEVDEVALAEMQALSTTVSPDRGHGKIGSCSVNITCLLMNGF
ncbi:hypothetical protein M8818_007245 [Zalaria obscura]|uniref:Uncharacterized protein n=1 Tax=Zalaria obscura TaxID=2024903 RepID=A0ACC3S8R9_9PEZI